MAWIPEPSQRLGNALATGIRGDVLINEARLSDQRYLYYTALHELGHALGLDHPHDRGATGLEATFLYSVMNYAESPHFVPPLTLMLYDIASLQRRYGDGQGGAGDTTYVWSASTAAGPWAAGWNHLDSNLKTIWDAGGRDAIVASAATHSVIIDLREGQFSSLRADGAFNVAIAFRAVIEDATGGSRADLLIGNGHANLLQGGDGADRIFGDGRVYGVYKLGTDQPPPGHRPEDERALSQQDRADILAGGDGNDLIAGGDRNAILQGGSGRDVLIGGSRGNELDGGADGDLIINLRGWALERINGGAGNDIILNSVAANDHAEVLRRLQAAGTPTEWRDLLQRSVDDFRDSRNAGPMSSSAEPDNTSFASIDGGEGDDLLFGSAGSNLIEDESGTDYLHGGAGADYIIATAGDTVDGGAGNDHLEADGAGRVTYVFGRGSGHDVLGTPFWGDTAFADRRDDVVHLAGLAATDLELVWAFEETGATLDSDHWIFRFGEAALRIATTGETFHLGQLQAVFHNPALENPGSEVGYAVILGFGSDSGPKLYQGTLPAWNEAWPNGPYVAISGWGAPTQHTPFMLDDGSRLSIMDLFDLRTLDPIEMDPIYVSAFEEFGAGAAGAAIVGAAGVPVAGTAGSDLIVAHVSGSVVSAGDGDDEVLGGRGWDSVVGGHGADLLRGGAGDDTLVGWVGNDTLDGGAGTDRLVGGTGDDLIHAGAGDVVVEAANQGIDTVVGVGGTARTLGANQEVLILEATSLLTGTGNALANVIIGNASANTLWGLIGDDRLVGLDGADLLVGGAGSDTLDGGAGADRFRFVALADSTVAAPDLILGFRADATSLADRIDLRTIDADPVAAGDQAFVFIGAAAFNGTRGALRFDAVAGGEFLVSGDVDGDGAADFAIRVAAPVAPVAGWFLL